METSAKTGLNAKELFVEAAKLLYQDYNIYKTKKAKKQGEKLKKDDEKPAQKKGTCC